MSSIIAAFESLDRDAYTKLALALFVGLPVVSTVLHILRQVRFQFSSIPLQHSHAVHYARSNHAHYELTLGASVLHLEQLLPQDPNRPPVVWSWFPLLGSTISYGMNPVEFFFACREKVRSRQSCIFQLLVSQNQF